MSKASTSSRIPTFGSKYQQSQQQQINKPTKLLIHNDDDNNDHEEDLLILTQNDLGRKVRIIEKIGVLRYVGNVHFSDDIWCGIELNQPIGKHNGLVNGVRYFNCPFNCGLMAPLYKVRLLLDDNLMIESATNTATTTTPTSTATAGSGPYSILFIDDNITRNSTNLITDKDDDCDIIFDDSTIIDDTTQIENKTFCITNNLKRTNSLEDDSNDNDGDSNNTTITTNTTINKNCIQNDNIIVNPSSSGIIEPKRRRTSVNLIDKPSSLPQQLKSSYNHNQYDSFYSTIRSNKYGYSTPTSGRGELEEFFVKRLQLNENENKRDSLECDESLGILTPEQMIDELSYGIGSRSPSTECKPIIISNKSASIEQQQLLLHSPTSIAADFSLGILDEQLLSNITFNTTDSLATNNMELLLFDKSDKYNHFNRQIVEQTPSPEELPLDPIPIIADNDSSGNISTISTSAANNTIIIDDSSSSHNLATTKLKTTTNNSNTSNSNTNNSFITSITSITSLDTGYQGDGEMSRPASRGADDNSPLTKRPLLRPSQQRKMSAVVTAEPLTDSDFYTESDADNHDDNNQLLVKGGDRHAQVIDGTLYGVDPQAAAEIYVNNRENMDSSGIFTDLESSNNHCSSSANTDDNSQSNNYCDGHNNNNVRSPSDTSSKTLSPNSQDNLREILINNNTNNIDCNNKKNTNKKEDGIMMNTKKRSATSSPIVSSPSSVRSPKHGNGNIMKETKKFKMPKRDVSSKVKTMQIEPTAKSPTAIIEKKTSSKKSVGRWDSVMNKMTKPETINKTNFKEVKSKVFNHINNRVLNDATKVTSNTPKKLTSQNSKPRRIRARTTINNNNSTTIKTTNVGSSVHSSLSDLSAAGVPRKKTIGQTIKKRGGASDVVQVTQVLTASKLSPRSLQQQQQNNNPATTNNNINNNKNQRSITHNGSQNDCKSKKTLFQSKDKKAIISSNTDCTRASVKGGRTSPAVRPPTTQTRAQFASAAAAATTITTTTTTTTTSSTKPVPKVTEALAVLVQHLVFNVEAYKVPQLKRDVQQFRTEIEQVRLACQQLEQTLNDERAKHLDEFDEQRNKYEQELSDLIAKHQRDLSDISERHLTFEQRLRNESESNHKLIEMRNNEQIVKLKKEFEKLQNMHGESLDILREENDAIREQIDEKNFEIDRIQQQKASLCNEYELKQVKVNEQMHNLTKENQKMRLALQELDGKVKEQMQTVYADNMKLKEENELLLSYRDDKGISMQEVQSLRVVLELKQNEVAELRKSLALATQRNESLQGAEERAAALNARCEDLQLQLERKSHYEQTIIADNKKLEETIKEEINQKKRLRQHNEELQWKLKQNKEVVCKVLEQAEESALSRTLLSSSFNDRYSNVANVKSNFERSFSLREHSSCSVNNSGASSTSTKKFDLNNSDGGYTGGGGGDSSGYSSPPTSPKVKGVVEKSDSVSYVLDLDESPEIVASRIVRRSFRHSTPPPPAAAAASSVVNKTISTTPTKSPTNNKRPRHHIKNHPLRFSASASNISPVLMNNCGGSTLIQDDDDDDDDDDGTSSNRINNIIATSSTDDDDMFMYRNINNNNNSNKQKTHHQLHFDEDDDDDDDLKLPALPSEIGRKINTHQALPSPKHLAGEAMISESNSDDESTTSSSSVQL